MVTWIRAIRSSWLLPGMVLLAVAGCAEDASTDDDDDDDVHGTEDLSVTLSETIPTVGTLSWSPDDSTVTAAHVAFGRDGAVEFTAPLPIDGGEPYLATLWGMKPATDYSAHVEAENADGSITTGAITFTTGYLPTDLPALELEVSESGSDMAAGGFLITSLFTGAPAPLILDRDGDIVWWYMEEDEGFQINRARLSRDGTSVYYWSPNIQGMGPPGGTPVSDSGGGAAQKLVRVSLDGAEVDTLDLTDGHHDFVELPDGTLTYIEYDRRVVESTQIDGDRIMELSPDGDLVEVYSVWDDFEYEAEDDPGNGGPPEGWTHANAIRYVEADDSYYVSLRAKDGILKIDRSTGDLVWVLGGAQSDFTDAQGGESTYFNAQHGFQVLDGSLLVFNNGDVTDTASRALEIELDETALISEQIWEYAPDPRVFCPTLGDIHRFESGNTLVLFSTAGQLDEVTPEGEVVWRLTAEIGGALGYGVWTDSLYVTTVSR